MGVTKYEKVIDYAVKRGFLWQSYEIYGGQSGFYDLGPLGVLLKNNIVNLWREFFIKKHQEFVIEIETPIVTPSIVFKASGHEENFTDYATECTQCHRVFRADHLIEEKLKISVEGYSAEELNRLIIENDIRCPICNGILSDVKKFLLLFQTYIGPYSPENLAYLRPEAAQGMFINFKRVYDLAKHRLPLGIAQIGKVARNEISPRQGPIRLREFTIMEIEFFYDENNPNCDLLHERCQDEKIYILTAEQREREENKPITISPFEAFREGIIKSPWLAYWMCIASKFVNTLGVPTSHSYFEEKLPRERAHYSKQTFDQMVIVDRWGKLEVSGHAYRHTYDLERHILFSKADLYALRQLKTPKIIKKVDIKYDKDSILKIFGSKAGEVFKALSSISKDDLLVVINSSQADSIVLNNIVIPKNVFNVIETEEKQWIEKFIPSVSEPSFGAERLMYIVLEYAYEEQEGRIVLRFPARIAPIKVAITPLVDREPLKQFAKKIYEILKEHYYVMYIEGGTIGKKYALADELGIPFVITIDYDSVSNNDATVRERDTRKQIRVPIKDILNVVNLGLNNHDIFNIGYPVIEHYG